MAKIWRVTLTYALLAIVLFIYRNPIIDWLQHGQAPIGLLFAAAVILAFVPIIPYKLVIGALGIVYGPLVGALLSWLATTLASIIVFVVVRHYFHEQGRAYLARYRQTERIAVLLERRPFVTIVIAKLIPVVPSMLINIYPAVLSIRMSTFIAAVAIGKIPLVLTFAFLGHELLSGWRAALWVGVIYTAFLLALIAVYRRWERRQA